MANLAFVPGKCDVISLENEDFFSEILVSKNNQVGCANPLGFIVLQSGILSE